LANQEDGLWPSVLTEVRGHVLVVTLNRPDALNAVNQDVSRGVAAAMDKLASDPALRVGVITGAGRAFCAGADLKALATGVSLDSPDCPDRGFGGLVRNAGDKPLIAAVNGAAMGGGMELMLACDLVVAADSAVFGLPEVRWGLFAGAGAMLRLTNHLPINIAMEIALTGESISAETAHRWGLINSVVPVEQLMVAALALATTIAENAPLAVQATRRLLRRNTEGPDQNSAWAENDAEFAELLLSEDGREGPRAFAERRAPIWVG